MADDNIGSKRQSSRERPIFILGILPRCGTNFLSDLLCLHPDCGPPAPIWEDFLVVHCDLLAKYVDTVHGRWSPEWGVADEMGGELAASLGEGMAAFLRGRAGAGRVVTKTPRVDNLGRFFTFFPDARLLILVRDGRAVLESGVKTFGWHFDSALHRMADAADTILDFDAANRDSDFAERYRIVKYENLWTNLEQELNDLLGFLELDADRYDFEAARSLPIRGSSSVRDGADGEVRWKPVEKPAGFDPMSRFRHWNRARHERFNWVAGRPLESLGYEPLRSDSNRLFWLAFNVLLDMKWQVVRTLGPVYLKLKGQRR